MPRRLTSEQIESYRRNGFAGPVPVLSPEEVSAFRAGLEAFERASGKALDFPERSKSYLLFDWADAIVHHPAVLDAVEDVIGPDILCYHLTMHIKEPGRDAVVVWHQDDDYFRLDPGEQVTAWVALSDASVEAGCMRMIPGSHHEGHIPHDERPSDNHLIRAGKGILDRYLVDDGVPVPVGAGEMSLHHTHTVHGSGPNRGTDWRIGVGVSYVPAHVRPKHEPRSSALLVRGADRHHHFHPETRLVEALSPAAREAHRRAYGRYMAATGIRRAREQRRSSNDAAARRQAVGRVQDKVAVVTGAANGLGRAIAVRLAAEGARLVLGDIEADGLDRTVETITAAGGEALACLGDVTEEGPAMALVDTAVERFGRIDVLVNNVGGARNRKIWEMEVEDWDHVIRLNLRGTFLCTRQAVRHMMKQGSGRIVCLSSGAREGTPWTAYYQGGSAYSTAKAGVHGFMRDVALELAEHGIAINAVAPGPIDTERVGSSLRQMDETVEYSPSKMTPMRRLGTPQEVAAAVLFLASDEASYVTGHNLAVAGGR